MAFVDHCQTAEDVIRNAREVVAKRRAQLPKRPMSIIPFSKPIALEPSLEVLIRAAYPARYPLSRNVSVREIQAEVCRVCGVKLADMLSSRRHKGLVEARMIAVMLTRHLTPKSFPEIGRLFGGRDHTTIIHARVKMEPVLIDIKARLHDSAPLSDWVAAAVEAHNRIRPKGIGRKLLSKDLPSHA